MGKSVLLPMPADWERRDRLAWLEIQAANALYGGIHFNKPEITGTTIELNSVEERMNHVDTHSTDARRTR